MQYVAHVERFDDMRMNKKNVNKIIGFLGLILRCPICNNRYEEQDTEVLKASNAREIDSRILIHSDCGKCKGSVIFSVDIHDQDVFSVGMVTDLTFEDSLKFQEQDSLSADECIAMHELVKADMVDFRGLFKPGGVPL